MQRPLSAARHLRLSFRSLVFGSVLWICALLGTILWASPPLDRSQLRLPQNIQVLDRTGKPLYRFYNTDDRSTVKTEEIPKLLRDAVVAIEDKRFFTRKGCIDPRAMLRAFVHNLTSDDVQGGSTITQQLVRNLYLTADKTYTRKLQELWLACRLEQSLSREDILTLYLNRVGFGGAVYGVEEAAQTYFGVSADAVTLPQIAVLAGLPQQPSSYAPGGLRERTAVDHAVVQKLRKGEIERNDIPPAALRVGLLGRTLRTKKGNVYVPGRADAVLNLLEEEGVVTQTAAAQAHDALRTMQLTKQDRTIAAPHFSQWIRSQAEAVLMSVEQPEQWLRAGLIVNTTIEPTLQKIAEESVLHHLQTVHAQGGRDVALVALDRRTREILAYVGNVQSPENTKTASVDMVRAPRQPGSSIKPLIYAFAFERGWTPDTIVKDTLLTIGGFRPKNYEGGYLGYLTVREALARSRNIPAIRAFLEFNDEDGVLSLFARAGAPTSKEYKETQLRKNKWFTYGWPMAIGSAELPLIELTTAYATISDHGREKDPKAICSVTDRDYVPLLTPPQNTESQAIIPEAAMMVDDILRDSSARQAGFWRDVLTLPGARNGAKTGTSNLCLQQSLKTGQCLSYAAGTVWTLGYTDDIVAGVLVGNADGSPMTVTADGLTVAAPIWHEFMERAMEVRYQAGCR